jgi:hypothetical protein
MKIADGFILRAVNGANGEVKNVVITAGPATEKLNGMITLNNSCAFIWKILEKGATREEVLNAMAKEYSVEVSEIESDVDAVINGFKQLGAIDE